jgi:hypothetical protein
MKSIKMLAGTAALAIAAFALAPVPNAAALMKAPISCNQKLVDCIDQATATFACCAYAGDRTLVGVLSGYCGNAGYPGYGSYVEPAPSAPGRPTPFPVCVATFNGTTALCNVSYGICTLLNPGK